MSIPPAESLGSRLFPLTSALATEAKQSEVQCEVIRLFDELRTPSLRYVLSLGLSVHDGEEVVQEVFLALLRHLRLGRPRDNLRGWIFRVAHNLALKRRQAAHRSPEASEVDWESAQRRPDPARNPEQQFSDSQRQTRLLSVFRSLPEEDRCCLRLRAEGLRYREIASVLGMSLGAISSSLTKSLARMSRADEG
jgi:RNA polymerase sigma-70 factor (ECF subfamily)